MGRTCKPIKFRMLVHKQGELLDITDKDIAKYFGVTRQTVSTWLREPEAMPIGRFRKFATLLNFSDDDILEVIK